MQIHILNDKQYTDADQFASSEGTDLDLHCMQRQGISGMNRTRVKKVYQNFA